MIEYFRLASFILLSFTIACNTAPEKLTNDSRILPILNPSDMNPDLVDRTMRDVEEGHYVLDFTLINQFGEEVTQKDYKDKVYVVDFFFTRCLGVCPVMTRNMVDLQKALDKEENLMFLSISVTPVEDSVSVLADYVEEKGILDENWNVCTGEKAHIYELARKSYFATNKQGDGGLQDFIHSSNFILVDKNKQIRGIYDGTKEEEMEVLEKDILLLLNS
jgi:protein SCO1/2